MGDRHDNFNGTVTDSGTFVLLNLTHLEFPLTVRAAAYAAAQQGLVAFDSWIAAQPIPSEVKAWHASLDQPRREGRRQAMLLLGPGA
jgi:hypothetical protein